MLYCQKWHITRVCIGNICASNTIWWPHPQSGTQVGGNPRPLEVFYCCHAVDDGGNADFYVPSLIFFFFYYCPFCHSLSANCPYSLL
ncbi:hypothetical protein FKM82_026503 [Ascaphus truei]